MRQIPRPGGNGRGNNVSRFCNADYDKLVKELQHGRWRGKAHGAIARNSA